MLLDHTYTETGKAPQSRRNTNVSTTKCARRHQRHAVLVEVMNRRCFVAHAARRHVVNKNARHAFYVIWGGLGYVVRACLVGEGEKAAQGAST